MKTKDILLQIKNSVQQSEPGAKVILYGSYARGDNHKGSDIDILILIEKEKVTPDDVKRITYPLYDMEFNTGIFISPLVLPRKVWEQKHRITPFYENVINEGKVL